MSPRIKIALLILTMIFSLRAAGTRCDTSTALQDLITSFNVDSITWKSTYNSTINISLGTTPAMAITYNIEGLGSMDRLAVILVDDIGQCRYRFRILDTFDQQGVMPEVLTVFNVNADKDQKQELVILIGWHYDDLNFRGYLYKASFYDYPPSGKNKFRLIQSASDRFPIEGEGLQMDKRLHAKYNTESKIRRRLKQLGY